MFAESVLQSNEIYNSSSAEETILCGENFQHGFIPAMLFALYGNLGSGKTNSRKAFVKDYVFSKMFTQ